MVYGNDSVKKYCFGDEETGCMDLFCPQQLRDMDAKIEPEGRSHRKEMRMDSNYAKTEISEREGSSQKGFVPVKDTAVVKSLDPYRKITDVYIEMLNAGTVPWFKPEISYTDGAYNCFSKRRLPLLDQTLVTHGKGPYGTFRQWTTDPMSGMVRKGEKADWISFWQFDTVKDTQTGELKRQSRSTLSMYGIFHASQIDNIYYQPLDPEETGDPVAQSEALIIQYAEAAGVRIERSARGDGFYRSDEDTVNLPDRSGFDSEYGYYYDVFKLLLQSTNQPGRVPREDGRDLSDPEKIKRKQIREWLIAEMGAGYLLGTFAFEQDERVCKHENYLGYCKQVLSADKYVAASAGSIADKAVRYIFGCVAD